ASTKDMSVFPDRLLCRAKERGLRAGGQYLRCAHKLRCRPGLEPGPITTGFHLTKIVEHRISADSTTRYGSWLSPGRQQSYTAAVVTPPSTTMVWPVMKVEASEAR